MGVGLQDFYGQEREYHFQIIARMSVKNITLQFLSGSWEVRHKEYSCLSCQRGKAKITIPTLNILQPNRGAGRAPMLDMVL